GTGTTVEGPGIPRRRFAVDVVNTDGDSVAFGVSLHHPDSPSPPGFDHLALQADLTSSVGTGASAAVTIQIDASQLEPGDTPDTLQVFNADAQVADCAVPGVVGPDPCIDQRQLIDGGDIQFVVLSASVGSPACCSLVPVRPSS